MWRARHLVFIIATASTLAIASESRAQGQPDDPSVSLMKPMVSTATVNDQTRTITIHGGGFGTVAPTVSLGGALLTVTSFDTAAQIVKASVPSGVTPGIYKLTIAIGTNTSTAFDVTIGTKVAPEPRDAQAFVIPESSTESVEPRGSTSTTQGPGGPVSLPGTAGPLGSLGPQGPIGPQGLKWTGPWQDGAAYNENDAVSFNGSSYISLFANNTRPPNTSFWNLLAQIGQVGPQGSQGSQGAVGPMGPAGLAGREGSTGPPGLQGLSWRGPWASAQAYVQSDAVSFNGSSYVSLVAGNAGNQPDTTRTMWNLLAQMGAQGSQGPQGPSGFQGVPGLTGLQGPVGLSGPVGPQGLQGPPSRDGSGTRTKAMVSVYDANNLLVGDVIGFGDYGPYVLVESDGQLITLLVSTNLLWNLAGENFGSKDCTGRPIIDADWKAFLTFSIAAVVRVPGGFDVYLPDPSSGPISTVAHSLMNLDGYCYGYGFVPFSIQALPALPPIHLAFTPPFQLRRNQ